MMSDANKKTPMFQGHGDADMVVNYKFGEMTAEALQKLGVTVDFHTFPDMGHEADPDELNLLRDWMGNRLTIHERVEEPSDKRRDESNKERKESKG
jgi:predicted esterase